VSKNREELKFCIALTLVNLIGPASAKNLLSYCGSPEAVFLEKKSRLLKIPGIGETLANSILAFNQFDLAEKELEFIEKNKIKTYFYTDKDYPQRLKRQSDSPMLLYSLGNMSLNTERIISIVGTRKASEYGKSWTAKFVEDLKAFNVTVVSGLAYGIDIAAHRACVINDIPTIGVLAHGLDRLYPPGHKTTAKAMLRTGGLLTEYPSGTNPDRENFPTRNRIVAGLCDATIIVESALRGGAVITANLAANYNRDVFAVPGKTSDPYSTGCHFLIKTNKAALIESAEDLSYYMGWNRTGNEADKSKQQKLALNLTESEQILFNLLKDREKWHIDELQAKVYFSSSTLALTLLELELKGIVKSFPGKQYGV
jgi:DNA processing protein